MVKIIRAKDNHPLHKVLNELWDKMDELGLRFELPLTTFPTRVEYQGQIWELTDLEHYNEPVTDFPPGLEYKLIREE